MSRSTRSGFTLTELIVVIVIIVILAGLMLPAVRRVREPAERMSCSNNLHQLMMALANYESMHTSDMRYHSTYTSEPSTTSVFPPGCIGPGTVPEEQLSWMVALLPYLEQNNLYKQIDLKKGYAANLATAQTKIQTLLCPAVGKAKGTTAGLTNYVAMAGIGADAATRPAGAAGNGFMGYDRLTSSSMIKDGTSNTIALLETCSGLGPWARGGSSNVRGFDPADVPIYGDERPFGGHKNGMNAAFADGSLHFIGSSINPSVLADLITIDGGEQIDALQLTW
jgi:prepilin-type N-terminal cleavage/methylation domain-containing protein/prepilin-type processing-associated H-X9-DG protein